MDIRKHLNAMRAIYESFTGDAQVDEMITKELNEKVLPEHQEKVLDLLAILRNAGREGIESVQWADEYKKFNTEEAVSVRDLLKLTFNVFHGICIEKIGPTKYRWILEGTADVPQHIRNAVETSVNATSKMLEKAKQMGQFHIGTLIRVGMAIGMDSNTAMFEAMKLINHFPRNFRSLGDGNYEYVDDVPKQDGPTDYKSFFNDLRKRAERGDHNVRDDED